MTNCCGENKGITPLVRINCRDMKNTRQHKISRSIILTKNLSIHLWIPSPRESWRREKKTMGEEEIQ